MRPDPNWEVLKRGHWERLCDFKKVLLFELSSGPIEKPLDCIIVRHNRDIYAVERVRRSSHQIIIIGVKLNEETEIYI